MRNPGMADVWSARPGKEQVRRWLIERALQRQPLPEPDAIRRAVGWTVAADTEAVNRTVRLTTEAWR